MLQLCRFKPSQAVCQLTMQNKRRQSSGSWHCAASDKNNEECDDEGIVRLCNRALEFGVPLCAVQVMALLHWLGHVNLQTPLDCVEYFAGQQAVTNGFRAAGFRSVAYEVKRDSVCMDILSDAGYAFAVALACQLQPGRFSLLAPVCSTWVWMCRHSAQRGYFQPLGNKSSEVVQSANVMVSRCVLLVMIMCSKGCMVVLEQPASSLMQYPARRAQ